MFKSRPNCVFKAIDRVGILRINTKLVIPLLFCLMITLNSGIVFAGAVNADKYALSKNSTLEDADAQMALDDLLSGFGYVNGSLAYQENTFVNTLTSLEILHELDQLTLLNSTITQGLVTWIDSKRVPVKSYDDPDRVLVDENYVEKEINGTMVTVNEPIIRESHSDNTITDNWWGTLKGSLDAARILKLLGHLANETVNDIIEQTKQYFDGGQPVLSLTHPDYPDVYNAFVTAYEYELFDMFTEYNLPKIDMEAVEMIDTYSRQDYYPYSWGEEIARSKANFTFHAGYETQYNISSNDSVSIPLPTLADWFSLDKDQPIPYQTITVNWVPVDVPNREDIDRAITKGLAQEVYLNISTDPEILDYYREFFVLEEYINTTDASSSYYRYYDWNYETLWYEMEARLKDANTGNVITTMPVNMTTGEVFLNTDLTESKEVMVEIEVKQALHDITFEWDNNEYSVPLEGWKNESCILLTVDNNDFLLDVKNNNLTLTRQDILLKEATNGTVEEIKVEEVNSWNAPPETVVVVELDNKELHTFRYDNPFLSYSFPVEITTTVHPLFYGEVTKSDPDGEMFIDMDNKYVTDSGDIYSWNVANTEPLTDQRAVGDYALGSFGRSTGYTFLRETGTYHVLIYPVDNNATHQKLNTNTTEIYTTPIRVQNVIYETNPIEEYMPYLEFLNQSESEFYNPINASSAMVVWEEVTTYTKMLARIAEAPLTYVTNIYPILDTIYSYQNTSTYLFMDQLSKTDEIWTLLDDMGYFTTLVSDAELDAVYTTIMEKFYHEETETYTSRVTGEEEVLVIKAGFSDLVGEEGWDSKGTLAGIRLLKKIRAREALSGGGGSDISGSKSFLKEALIGPHHYLGFLPDSLENHGLMWETFMADQDVKTNLNVLVFEETLSLQENLESQYDLAYEEIYHTPKIALSKNSVLIPVKDMYWREEPTQKSATLPFSLNSTTIVTIMVLAVGVLIGTEVGGKNRGKLMGIFWILVFMIQGYAVAFVGSAGFVVSLEEQLAVLNKIITYLEDQIYMFSDNVAKDGFESHFARPMLHLTVYGGITTYNTMIVEDEIEDKSIPTGYETYLKEFQRYKTRSQELYFSHNGITTPSDLPVTTPLSYEQYVQSSYQETANGELIRLAFDRYDDGEDLLEYVKTAPCLGEFKLKNLVTTFGRQFIPDVDYVSKLKARYNVAANLKNYAMETKVIRVMTEAMEKQYHSVVKTFGDGLKSLMGVTEGNVNVRNTVERIMLDSQIQQEVNELKHELNQRRLTGGETSYTLEQQAIIDYYQQYAAKRDQSPVAQGARVVVMQFTKQVLSDIARTHGIKYNPTKGLKEVAEAIVFGKLNEPGGTKESVGKAFILEGNVGGTLGNHVVVGLITHKSIDEIQSIMGIGGILTLCNYDQRITLLRLLQKQKTQFYIGEKGEMKGWGTMEETIMDLAPAYREELPVLIVSSQSHSSQLLGNKAHEIIKESGVIQSTSTTFGKSGGTSRITWLAQRWQPFDMKDPKTRETILVNNVDHYARTARILGNMTAMSNQIGTPNAEQVEALKTHYGIRMDAALGALGFTKSIHNVYSYHTTVDEPQVSITVGQIRELKDIAIDRLTKDGDPRLFVYIQLLEEMLTSKWETYQHDVWQRDIYFGGRGMIDPNYDAEPKPYILRGESPCPFALRENDQSLLVGVVTNMMAIIAADGTYEEKGRLAPYLNQKGDKSRKQSLGMLSLVFSEKEGKGGPKTKIRANRFDSYMFNLLWVAFGKENAMKTYIAVGKHTGTLYDDYWGEALQHRYSFYATESSPPPIWENFRVIFGLGRAPEGLDFIIVKPQQDNNGIIIPNKLDITLVERKNLNLREGIGYTPSNENGRKQAVAGSKIRPSITMQTTLASQLGSYFGIGYTSEGEPYAYASSQLGFLNELLILQRTGNIRICRGLIQDTTDKHSNAITIDFATELGDPKFAKNVMDAVITALDKSIGEMNDPGNSQLMMTQRNISRLKDRWIRNIKDDQYGRTLGTYATLQYFFDDFYLYNLGKMPQKNFGGNGMTKAFWTEFLKVLREKNIVKMSPTRNAFELNFLLNGIPDEFMSLNEKVAAMTSAYYTTYQGYEEPDQSGYGYVQGQVPDSTVALLKVPEFDIINDAYVLDWGSNLTDLNISLDRDDYAQYMITGGTEQTWDDQNNTITLAGSLHGSAGGTVIGVKNDTDDHDSETSNKIVIPMTALVELMGATVPLEQYPTVQWEWRNVPVTPNSIDPLTGVFGTDEETEMRDYLWNQGEVVFYVENQFGDTKTIGVMATTDKPTRSSTLWQTDPDIELFVDPITWVSRRGEVATDGSISETVRWMNPYVPENINLYQIARDAFVGSDLSIEGLQLTQMVLSNNTFDFHATWNNGDTEQITYFGGFEFAALGESDEFSYWQTVAKAFYLEYTESDGEISLADEEKYDQYSRELATGVITGSSDMTGETNAQSWVVEARKEDIYDEFAEFKALGIAIVKNTDGEYIGEFFTDYTFPESAETQKAPKWTRIPEEESLPIYVYYDMERINGWNDDLWYYTALTLAQQLAATGQNVQLAGAEELYAIMGDDNVRAIVVMLGAIPDDLWGYIDPEELENTTGAQAATVIKSKSVIEAFLKNGGTLIGAGPYGGFRGVCYLDNYGEYQLGDYRAGDDFPITFEDPITITADPTRVVFDGGPTGIFGNAWCWMTGSNPDIDAYYSSGVNTTGWSSTYPDYYDRIIEVYASGTYAGGTYKDLALRVNKGIYVNYHTADDNEGEGALNYGNGQGFIDDLVTIITGLPQSQETGFIPNTSWLPGYANQETPIYALEDFEQVYAMIGNVGEAGTVEVGDTAHTVKLRGTYNDPVVVAVPVLGPTESRSGTDTSQQHIITDVQSDRFTIVQRESGNGDSIVDTTSINYLVLEQGTYSIGTLDVEVGTQSVNGSYETVNLTTSFTSNPIILAATQTDNNSGKVRTRVNSISTNTFQVQVEEGDDSTPSLTNDETVGYIAIEQGADTNSFIEAQYTPDEVTHSFETYTYTNSYSDPPIVIAHLDKEDGGDPSLQVVRDITTTNFETAVEESCGYDGSHTSELIGWVAIPVQWENIDIVTIDGDNVGEFESGETTVSATGGVFSDLTGINVLEYPILEANLRIPEEWTSVYTSMHDYEELVEFDSGDSYATADTTTKIEGVDAFKFEYSLPTTDIVGNFPYASSYEDVNITINDDVIWTFSLLPDVHDSDDLNALGTSVDDWDQLIKRPDIWNVKLKIIDGTGLTKYLNYYYSFKTSIYYDYQVIPDPPTDFTLFYDGSSWRTIRNYSDGESDDDNTRYIEIPMMNGEWNRITRDVLSDFNSRFVVDETKITIDGIYISYLGATYTNTGNKNHFYLDDCIFIKPDSDEYYIQQDYTDGENVFRVYSGVSSDGTLDIDSVTRSYGDWWRGDFATDGYDYEIVVTEGTNDDPLFGADEIEAMKWVALRSDGINAISLVAAEQNIEVNQLYYLGKPTIHRSDTTDNTYIDNICIVGSSEYMVLDDHSKYENTPYGISLRIAGTSPNNDEYAIRKSIPASPMARDFPILSFDMRISDQGTDPIKVGVNPGPKTYWYELEVKEGWSYYEINVFDCENNGTIDYFDTIGSIYFVVGDGDVWLDNVMLSGIKGVAFFDDMEYSQTHVNYGEDLAFQLNSEYFSDHWFVVESPDSPSTFIMKNDSENLATTPMRIDSTQIDSLMAGVEGTGTFEINLRVFDEDGSYSREISLGEKTLSGWGTIDEYILDIGDLNTGERYLAHPMIEGNGTMMFEGIMGIPNNQGINDTSGTGSMNSEKGLIRYFTSEIEEAEWSSIGTGGSGYGLLWDQDMSSFGSWSQVNGDTDWSSMYWPTYSTVQHDMEIDNDLITNGWTGEGYAPPSYTLWWSPPSSSEYAMLYREVTELTDDKWEFMTKIYCDLGYQSGSSCAGGMVIEILDDNYQSLVEVWVFDGSGSSGNHRTRARWRYRTGETTWYSYYGAYGDYDIDSEYFGLKLDDGKFYGYFPETIVQHGGQWNEICTEAEGEYYGTPTYLAIVQYDRYVRPIDAHWEELIFYGEGEGGGGGEDWSINDGKMTIDNVDTVRNLNLHTKRDDYTNIQLTTALELETLTTTSNDPEAGFVIRYQDEDEGAEDYAFAGIIRDDSDNEKWKAHLKYFINGTEYNTLVDLGVDPSLVNANILSVNVKDNDYVELLLNGVKYDISPNDPVNYPLASDGKVGLLSAYNEVLYRDFAVNDLSYDSASHLSPFRGTTKGLVGWYKLDEESGTIAYDSSGYKNHGDINGAIVNKVGKVDKCYEFDGSNDYINVPDFSLTDAFSVGFWLNPESRDWENDISGVNGWGSFVFCSDSLIEPGAVAVGTDLTNRITVLTANTVELNKWQQFVFTYDGNGTGAFYKNGDLIADKTGLLDPTAWGGLRIAINGCVDEVRIYNRAITEDEITTFYNNTSLIYTDASPEPILDLPLIQYKNPDDPANPGQPNYLVYDQSGNDHNGTSKGGAHYNVVEGAYDFDGTGDYINMHDRYDFSFNGDVPFTVEGWFNAETTTGQNNMIISKYQTPYLLEWYVNLDDNGYLVFRLNDEDGVPPVDNDYLERQYTTALSTDTWYHFACTYDGSESVTGLKIYLDGVRVDDNSDTSGSYNGMHNMGANLNIGASNDGDYCFDGYISSIRIYDCELTKEQVMGQLGSGILIPEGKQLITNENPAGNSESWVITALVDFTDEYLSGDASYSWEQDITTLTGWSQMKNDTNFDPDSEGHDFLWDMEADVYHSDSGKDTFAPYDWETAGYWASDDDDTDWTGVYRYESHLQDDEWEFMTKVSVDLGYQGSPYSCAGGMLIGVYGDNYELLMDAWIFDGSGSSNYHRTRGRFRYKDSQGDWQQPIYTSYGDYDIDSDYFGLKLSTDNNYYVYFPDLIPDDGGYDGGWSEACTEEEGEAYGTPTYLAIYQYKKREPPVDAHWEELKFSGGLEGIEVVTIDLNNEDVSVKAYANNDYQYTLFADDGTNTYDLGEYNYSGSSETVLSLPLAHLTRTKDSSVYGNDGTLYGDGTWNAEGLQFDGSGDYIDCGNDSSLDMRTDDWSIAAWIKTTATNGSIIEKRSGLTDWYELIIYSGGKARLEISRDYSTTGFEYCESIQSIADGTWHHVVATFDRDGQGSIYIDGEYSNSTSISSQGGDIDIASSLLIGGGGEEADLDGIIGPVTIHRRLLNEREILSAYENTLGTNNDPISSTLEINVETNKDPSYNPTPDIVINVSDGLNFGNCTIPVTSTSLNKVSFGDEESTSDMGVYSYEIAPIEPVLIRPLVSELGTSIKLEPWASIYGVVTNIRVYGNEIYGTTNDTADEFGFEIKNLEDVGGKYLIASVKVTNDEHDGKFVVEDLGVGNPTYTWDVTDEPRFNQMNKIHLNEWQTVIVPIANTSPTIIRLYVCPDSDSARNMGLAIGNITIASQDELKGVNTSSFTAGESDRVAHQQNGAFCLTDLGTVNGNSFESVWEITGFDYTLTDKTMLNFDFRLDVNSDEGVIAKLGIHGTNWYDMQLGKGGANGYSLNDRNDSSGDGYPDITNEWISVSIPVKEFFNEYYTIDPAGTIDKIRLIINESAQSCKFNLSISDIHFYEPRPMVELLTRGQDLRGDLEDAYNDGYGVLIEDWLASPLYPVPTNDSKILKTNLVQNPSFEEWNLKDAFLSDWSCMNGYGTSYDSTDGSRSLVLIDDGTSSGTYYAQQTVYPKGNTKDVSGTFQFSCEYKLSDTITANTVKIKIYYDSTSVTYNLPTDQKEWTSADLRFDVSDDDSILIEFRTTTDEATAYFDDVSLQFIPDTTGTEYANLRTFDPSKVAQGGKHTTLALTDGWYYIDAESIIPDLGSGARSAIAKTDHIQYFYTEIYVDQSNLVDDTWDLDIYPIGGFFMDGPWYLWINGVYQGVYDDGGSWSNLSSIVAGVNTLLVGRVNLWGLLANNLGFEARMHHSETPSSKFTTITPQEARTRQFAVYYDPQYPERWVDRISDSPSNNLEKKGGSAYTKDYKKILDLKLNEGSTDPYGECMDYAYSEPWTSTVSGADWDDTGLYFDGANDYIEVDIFWGGISTTMEWTKAAWVMATDWPASYMDIITTDDGNYSYLLVRGSDQKVGSFDDVYSTTALDLDKWYHVCVTSDGTTAKVYVNGQYENSGTATRSIGGDVSIGINPDQSTEEWKGYIREAQVWNYALNETEVKQVMLGTHYDPVEDNVTLIRDGINANLLSLNMPSTIMNAVRLDHYIHAERNMYSSGDTVWHPFGQILLTSDILPDTVWNSDDSDIEEFLEQGGKIVWPSGYIPFACRGSRGGSYSYIGDDDDYDYDGALGHQKVLDIDNDNNPDRERDDFPTGLFAYDGGSVNEYADDDYDSDFDYGTGTYGDKEVVNESYYWSPDRNGNYDLLKYDTLAGQNPAFTSSAWTGLFAHMILGKHEFDTSETDEGTYDKTWEVIDIDGYSAWEGAHEVNHNGAVESGNWTYNDYEGVNGQTFLAEVGTDPMDRGLWFKPYLADTNGAIEEDLIDGSTDNWYLKRNESTFDRYYYHHELWNVGTGSIQAGKDGKGIISVLPMFQWSNYRLPLTGIHHENDEGTDSDYYGLYNDRGMGGIIPTPSTRNVARGLLGISVGTMMTSMALDNVVVNVLRENDTIATNVFDPKFAGGSTEDKYPYGWSDCTALRTNGISDRHGNDDSFASFPMFTGDYNKWLFDNEVTLPDWSAYRIEDRSWIEGYNDDDSIIQLVYEGNQLITTMAVQTGGYDEDYPDPYRYLQYLSLENVRRDVNTSGDIIAGVVAPTWIGGTHSYAAKYSGVYDEVTFGVNVVTQKGGDPDAVQDWEVYPKTSYDQNDSYPIDTHDDIYENSGWGLWGLDLVDHNYNINSEIILRYPIVNLYNNQRSYELGLKPAYDEETIIPRGGIDSSGTENYGGTMPWSVYSPIILDDNYDDDNAAQNAFDTLAYTPDSIYWSKSSSHTFEGDYVIDTDAYIDTWGGGNGGGGDNWVGTQWLSDKRSEYIILENTNDTDDVAVDIIRITPALNCRWDYDNDGADGDDVYAKVEQIKSLRVALLDDATDKDSVIKQWILRGQRWQTTDFVIKVNESLTSDDAVRMTDGTGILIQILEVWEEDEEYGGVVGSVGSNNISSNFGGIAEVYLYGREYNGQDEYQKITTELSSIAMPESSERFPDPNAPWAIDGGSYFLDDNSITRRGMNGGTYQASTSIVWNDDTIGSYRLSPDNYIPFKVVSTDISPDIIAQYQELIDIEIAKQRKMQEMQFITTLISIAVAAIIMGAAAAITAPTGGWGALVVGAIIAGKVAAYSLATVATIMLASLVSPELGAFMGFLLQAEDVLASVIITGICGIADFTGLTFKAFLGQNIKARDIKRGWWMQNVAPLLYSAYCLVLDTNGTAARLVSRAWIQAQPGMTEDDVSLLLYDNYEVALMKGEVFNFFDPDLWFG